MRWSCSSFLIKTIKIWTPKSWQWYEELQSKYDELTFKKCSEFFKFNLCSKQLAVSYIMGVHNRYMYINAEIVFSIYWWYEQYSPILSLIADPSTVFITFGKLCNNKYSRKSWWNISISTHQTGDFHFAFHTAMCQQHASNLSLKINEVFQLANKSSKVCFNFKQISNAISNSNAGY